MLGAYAQSKLANILFTKELARRLPPKPVSANCLHPGVVATGIGNKGRIEGLIWSAIKPFMIGPEQGAVNSLFVATSPDIEAMSGAFFVKQRPAKPNPIAEDPAIAASLWAESERLVAAAL
jgi:NAD(P)-dependent dehydrogenase (short-subunit alcohol dehydrogenase family)